MTSGETLRGRVRYYDRDCFSLGPEKGRPKVFLRKEFVKYIYEEEADAKTYDVSHSDTANVKAEDSKDQKSKESPTGN